MPILSASLCLSISLLRFLLPFGQSRALRPTTESTTIAWRNDIWLTQRLGRRKTLDGAWKIVFWCSWLWGKSPVRKASVEKLMKEYQFWHAIAKARLLFERKPTVLQATVRSEKNKIVKHLREFFSLFRHRTWNRAMFWVNCPIKVSASFQLKPRDQWKKSCSWSTEKNKKTKQKKNKPNTLGRMFHWPKLGIRRILS